MSDLRGKIILVTGGARGIGFSCAKELLRHGVDGVAIVDINDKNGEAAVEHLTKEFGHHKAIFVKTDVTKEKEFEGAFKKTLEKWKAVDVLINNAGTFNDRKWELEIAVNTTSLVRGTLLGLQYMGKNKSGRGGVIVNMSSVSGLEGIPSLPIYSGTKQFVIGFSRSLGTPYHYNRTGVKIVTICPGDTKTVLNDIVKNTNALYLSNDLRELLLKASEATIPQQPIKVAQCVVQAIIEGNNGSVWVSENDECYEIELPNRNELRK